MSDSLEVLNERVKHVEADIKAIKESALTIEAVREAVRQGVKAENDATMAGAVKRVGYLIVVLLFTGIGTILTKMWENL